MACVWYVVCYKGNRECAARSSARLHSYWYTAFGQISQRSKFTAYKMRIELIYEKYWEFGRALVCVFTFVLVHNIHRTYTHTNTRTHAHTHTHTKQYPEFAARWLTRVSKCLRACNSVRFLRTQNVLYKVTVELNFQKFTENLHGVGSCDHICIGAQHLIRILKTLDVLREITIRLFRNLPRVCRALVRAFGLVLVHKIRITSWSSDL